MSSHLIVLPVVLPLVAGILLLFQRQGSVRVKRLIGVGATLALLLISIALVARAAGGEATDGAELLAWMETLPDNYLCN